MNTKLVISYFWETVDFDLGFIRGFDQHELAVFLVFDHVDDVFNDGPAVLGFEVEY